MESSWLALMIAWITQIPILVSACLTCSLALLTNESSTLIVWDICTSMTTALEFSFKIDWLSLVFLSTVTYVSITVFVYSSIYMRTDLAKVSFIILLSLFVTSMMILSVSGNILTSLVGWDGLGVTSFLLILHYQNWNSLVGGLITFVTNRLGDCFLILALVISLTGFTYGLLFEIGLVLASFTKSGQIPFSTWLPLAMAAPTPVSSLVHSSTLVTAGVYMLIRFNDMLSATALTLGLAVSSITGVVACLGALAEWDIKKVVALSTLSHISLMMMFVFMRETESAIIHLVMHALFKSALFMFVGNVIHNSESSQDLRHMSFYSQSSYDVVGMVICVASMAGLPFLAGFYSKEILLSKATEGNFYCALGFWLLAGGTAAYSTRLICLLVRVPVMIGSVSMASSNKDSFASSMILSSSVVGCVIVDWMGFIPELESAVKSSEFSKMLLYLVMTVSVCIGWMAGKLTLSRPLLKDLLQKGWFVASLTKSPTYGLRWISFYGLNYWEQKGQLDKWWTYFERTEGKPYMEGGLPGWAVYEVWISSCFVISMLIYWLWI